MSDPNESRPGYKETKVGWIPEDWVTKPISDVADVRFSGVDKMTVEGEAPVKLCNYTDVYYREKVGPDTDFMSASATKAEISRFELQANDVLVTKDSESADDIAVPCFVEADAPGVLCGYHLALLRPNADVISGRYLSFALKRDHTRNDFGRFANGVTRYGLTSETFGHVEIPLPALDEQRAIASILAECDEVIEKTGDLIQAKQRQKKVLMQQLLTGKKRLPGFEGEWTVRKLSEVLFHVFRPVEWAPDKIFHLVSIRRRSMGLFRREPLRGDEYKTTDLHELKAGDFVVSKRQVTHGALAMVTEEFDGCHVSKEYSILVNRNPKEFYMPFFDWLSRTRRLWWLAYVASNGVVIEKLIFEPTTFLKFEVLLPPSIEEQTAITEVLDTCDRELRALDQSLAALKQQKKALMQKLLTGQVRVKV